MNQVILSSSATTIDNFCDEQVFLMQFKVAHVRM